ncbi:SMP-30/gluconolaconase/LRE-like region family protein [Burkholderia ubonensis]|uniref:SMP-30/gluconolaconase/LRE-like region family protein n=1 Tax=Burkholderia ubonensis TaxID=101571 RepID=A0A119H5N7_9BURK|nr:MULTISPECIES: SMP-30/gluconolactonase/LRE family protein [Burkholderia]KIP13296.1 SMP-30/Gluconolaconase/LRE-like region family protein [Burkholderia sp. MSHR3999]KVD57654.1 SMP-30/gluconolaconase/LRE-like region family protein [Burkholderia ubonensis]KVD72570.1 SMP-30/gluconolaconase/LRE-like region family protein [Burkholderia ubonensis]KVW23777.1 SMP-30/gluconolaconase/LRE-like region family protein [Burkholderia ubonensis]KWA68459.1 SMP-30/gluconolaconase/LRE-like region family protein 
MSMKLIRAALLGAWLAAIASAVHAQYSTDWIANTFGTIAAHVGNGARSMWVAPEGVIYTSSRWDENAGGVAMYQNGQGIGTIGLHDEFQGGAITGNASSLFVALGYNRTFGSGSVGRYNRSTNTRDLRIPVSVWTGVQYADVITGLATAGTLLYVSDFYGNRVRVFTTNGVWQRDINVTGPGALALDAAGNLWVARKSAGVVVQYSPAGTLMNTIQMGAASRPSALYFDASTGLLMVGDEGPDMNIKSYGLVGIPAQVGTFGVQGGYLDTTSGIKGQVGDKRFTRVAGIGKDAAGNLYVLNNAWGGGWDLGRNGSTDLHAYSPAGALQWKLQALNFEAVAAPDPATDGAFFYSGANIYTGTAGGTFVANTIDPFTYPRDPRLDIRDYQRGQHFGQLVTVGGNRILVASGQNPANFNFYYFNAASGYIAIPAGSLPGKPFNTTLQVTAGFAIDGNGDVWAGLNGTNAITHYLMTGFDATGKPSWGKPTTIPVPATVAPVTRIVYQSDSDTMILAQGLAGNWDWTAMNGYIEVYHGWKAGNTSAPNPVITLTSPNPKSIAAAGRYLFVGYVHTVPNIDVFDLNTGSLVATLTNSNPAAMDVGNDVDSMYGIRAYLRSTGEYVITKDNYNGSSIVVYRWLP